MSGSSPPADVVAVAVSGGADSLYALARLRERGPVIALHGLFQRPGAASEGVRERLAAVCRRLGASFHCLDFSDDFERLVVRPFVEAYAAGLTPNPCALCNARVKFGLLLNAALGLGATRLATGHYAALEAADGDGAPALLRGLDESRDQSYFLALTPARALARALFPLADVRKTGAVEWLARQGLETPQPGESREICFIPDGGYQEALPELARQFRVPLPGPGPMLLADGRRVGTHKGLWRYTEGQRHGLGVGWSEPLHVLAKEAKGNVLRLGARADMRARGCVCGAVNALAPPESWPDEVLVKTRYREHPRRAEAEMPRDGAGTLRLRFAEPEAALAPGQVAALYAPRGADGRLRLLAGGIIEKTEG